MSNNIVGTSTICTSIIPNFKALENIYPYKLSREAKLRLRVIDYYFCYGHFHLLPDSLISLDKSFNGYLTLSH